jgi:hypothetical protein
MFKCNPETILGFTMVVSLFTQGGLTNTKNGTMEKTQNKNMAKTKYG